MKMKPNTGRRVAELRRIIGKSQSQFAAMIGVSIHTVISVENGRNQLSEKLARRIRIATGAHLLRRSKGKVEFVRGGGFSKTDFEEWRARFSSEEHSAKARFEEIKYWIELVFRAAARPGTAGNRDRLPAVYLSLVDWLHETRKAFKLEQEIDDILEEDPHEITNPISRYEDLSTNENYAKWIASELGMTPKELLAIFKQQMRGLKRQDLVTLHAFFEVRKAWNPDKHEIAGALDRCKIKKILPRGEFEFLKFIHSRTNPAREQFLEYFARENEPDTSPPDSPE